MPEQRLSIPSGPRNPTDATHRQITILAVDHEDAVLDSIRGLLSTLSLRSVTAKSTAEALGVARTVTVDVALIDWRLMNNDDGIALGRTLRQQYRMPFVLFGEDLTTDITGHAYRAGAIDVIDTPLQPERVLAAINLALGRVARAIDNMPSLPMARASNSASSRWAQIILQACRAQEDPNTESAMAAASSISPSVFRKICSACGVSARDTRDLTRLLRAHALARTDGSALRSHLTPMDPRTRARLFGRAGVPADARVVPLRQFLLGQTFVPSSVECVRELERLAAADPLFATMIDDNGAR